MSNVDFAILAPVPQPHLDDGLGVCHDTDYVSYGSQKWELFREVDTLRQDEDVPVLIYPSHEEAEAKLKFLIAWTGFYVGHSDSIAEKVWDEQHGHRPPCAENWRSAGDSANGWAVFWRVRDLTKLSDAESVPIRSLESYKSGHWRMDNPPHGPEIVARPSWI